MEKREFLKLAKWEEKALRNLLRDKLFIVDVAQKNATATAKRFSSTFIKLSAVIFASTILMMAGFANSGCPIDARWLFVFITEILALIALYFIRMEDYKKQCEDYEETRAGIVNYVCQKYNANPNDEYFVMAVIPAESFFPGSVLFK